MSRKRILNALQSIGLTQVEAEIYVLLANRGPQTKEQIAETLKLQKSSLHQILENLRVKGVVNSTRERSALLYAMPFEKVLELLLKEHLQSADEIEQNRKELLFRWQTMTKNSS